MSKTRSCEHGIYECFECYMARTSHALAEKRQCGPTHHFACDCREAALRAEADGLRRENAKLNARCDELEAEHADLRARADMWERNAMRADAELAGLRAQLKGSQSALTKAMAEVTEARAELAKADTTRKRLARVLGAIAHEARTTLQWHASKVRVTRTPKMPLSIATDIAWLVQHHLKPDDFKENET